MSFVISFKCITSIKYFYFRSSLTSNEKRPQGHPLKSFSVPAPPPQSAPSTPQQKHIGMYIIVNNAMSV